MIKKKKLTTGVIQTLPWGNIYVYHQYMTIIDEQIYWYIYLRSQVSVYRSIGSLVLFVRADRFKDWLNKDTNA